METIICKETGVRIDILKTNGGKGRINKVDIYDAQGNHKASHHIMLKGQEVQTTFVKDGSYQTIK